MSGASSAPTTLIWRAPRSNPFFDVKSIVLKMHGAFFHTQIPLARLDYKMGTATPGLAG